MGVQKLIEGAQGGQPPVDGGDGRALCLSAGDVAVHIADGVCVAAGGLLAGVVNVSAGVCPAVNR